MEDTNNDKIIHEIEVLMDMDDTLDKVEPSLDRLKLRGKIMKFINEQLSLLGYPEEVPDSRRIVRRYTDAVYRWMLDYVCIWPWDDSQAIDTLIENMPSDSLQVMSDVLSELKHKHPELYHPNQDRVIAL